MIYLKIACLSLPFFLNQVNQDAFMAVNASSGDSALRVEAREYAMGLVKLYFNPDCSKFYDMFRDSVYLLDKDTFLVKAGKREKLCESLNRAIRDKKKTLEDYIGAYTIDVLTPTEAENKFDTKLPTSFKKIEGESFFFIGHKLKEGAEDFIWDDMFIFIVSKKDGMWMVSGASG